MMELTEAAVCSAQLDQAVSGKKIVNVIAAQSPHKFAWYYKDPEDYKDRLLGRRIQNAVSFGGMVELRADEIRVLFGEGVSIRYHQNNETPLTKHQLLITFEDNTAISASVVMYGGLWCFTEGEFDNPYYLIAKEKPSPLSEKFDLCYFKKLLSSTGTKSLSAKAFLATQQRIPGLGNGLIQDILFLAGIHPRRKMQTLSDEEFNKLYQELKQLLSKIIMMGGRDTEKDIFGNFGGYETILSKKTLDQPCRSCNTTLTKETYLGGSIYYCSTCQK